MATSPSKRIVSRAGSRSANATTTFEGLASRGIAGEHQTVPRALPTSGIGAPDRAALRWRHGVIAKRAEAPEWHASPMASEALGSTGSSSAEALQRIEKNVRRTLGKQGRPNDDDHPRTMCGVW